MRNLRQFMLLVMVGSLVTLTSCSGDDDSSGSGGGAASGTMTAKIDGANYSNTNNIGQATLAQLPQGDNLIVQSSNSDGQSINLVIWNYNGPGTYDIDSSGTNPNTAIYTETDVDINNPQNSTTEAWQAPYQNSELGTITITEETDTNVKGEFSFKAKLSTGNSVINVTEGQFNLSKQTT
jgi:hypothetical protein